MSSHERGSVTNVTEAYEDKPAINSMMVNAGQAGAFGLIVSAIRNALGTHSYGALGIFTRTGGTIGLFAAVGAAFGLTDALVSNSRQKQDALNSAAGACASGLVVGAAARSVPFMFGGCAGLATLVGTFDAAGRSLTGITSAGAGGSSTLSTLGTQDDAQAGWREERERRRNAFFKPRKPRASAEGEEEE